MLGERNEGNWYATAVDNSHTISTAFSALLDSYAQIQVEALSTTATLSFNYTGNAEDGFEYSNIKIRFRGALDCSLWSELNSESTIQGYGVMVSLGTSTEGYLGSNHFVDEYNDKLEANSNDVDAAIEDLCDGKKIKNFYNSVVGEGAISPFSNGVKTSWALAQSVSYSSSSTKLNVLTRDYVAIAYIRTSSGLVFFEETRLSVKDLAQQMIDSGDYAESPLAEPLNYLATLGNN